MTDTYPIPKPPVQTKRTLLSPRGAKLATRIWPLPDSKKPKCLVLIVHGGGWHSGYFEALAKHLNDSVSAFCASYDQVGCGYSDREPGSPSRTCVYLRSFDDLIEDLFEALRWAKEEIVESTQDKSSKDLPTFLLGESFGAPQVIQAGFFAKKEEGIDLAGVISLGGLVKIGDDLMPPSFVVACVVWLAKYYPKWIMPGFDTESTFDDAFGDKKWARTARADSAIQISLAPTLSAAAATLSAGNFLLENARNFPVPFFAIHAKYDIRTKCEAVQEFVDKAGALATITIYEDTTGHQLLQDVPDVCNRAMGDVSKWIMLQLESQETKSDGI